MTLQHSPRHRAAGPAGFGRSPWPSQPIAVVPSPRPPSERPAPRTKAATTGATPARPELRIPAPRHAVPEGLAAVADLATVTSTPAPLPAAVPPGPAPRRRTGGALVRLTEVRRPARGAAPAAPAARPATGWSRGRAAVLGALAVVVVTTGAAATTLLVSGALTSHATPPASPWAQAAARVAGTGPTDAPAPGTVPARPVPAVASPVATLSGDGRLVVGTDIAVGVYRTAGPISPEHDCSWSRRGRGGAGETVLASGVPTGPSTVTVRPGDAVFVTRGCAPWTRAG